jgi:hypothetical protein
VRNEEEVETTVHDFRLFNEALVDVGSLGRVVDARVSILLRLLEEPLTDALVYDDECHLWWVVGALLAVRKSVFLLNDFVKLIKLEVNDLLSHGVANTISIDENVRGHISIVMFSIALERPHEVVSQDS